MRKAKVVWTIGPSSNAKTAVLSLIKKQTEREKAAAIRGLEVI